MIGQLPRAVLCLAITGALGAATIGTASAAATGSGSIRAGLAGGTATNAVVGPSGGLVAWGFNQFGQLGDGTLTSPDSAPGRVTGLDSNVKQVSAWQEFSLALMEDGTVKAWGDNIFGQLGNPSVPLGRGSTVPVPVPDLIDIVQVSAGEGFGLALNSDGQVFAWGYNGYATMGDPTNTSVVQRVPVPIPSLRDIVQIGAGGRSGAALGSDGRVWLWGLNFGGALGITTADGDTKRYPPSPLAGVSDAKQLEIGAYTGYAVLENRTVMSWGYSAYGLRGTGGIPQGAEPTAVTGLTDVRQLSAGGTHALALLGDGTVWGWGSDRYGQVLADGFNDRPDLLAPVRVIGPIAVDQVEATLYDSVALSTFGTVRVWGSGAFGLYGDGRGSVPTDPGLHSINGLTGVTTISGPTLGEHLLAITNATPLRVIVPDVVGLTCANATSRLNAVVLGSTCTTGAIPTVAAQSPPAGTPTIRGFTIALTMRTTVPDVLELSCDAAKAAIQAADLTTTCNGHNAWVFSQNPAPGTPANAGTPVILSLRNGPRP